MKIGISGPLTLNMLNFDPKGQRIPKDEHSPMISMLINSLIERGHQVVAYTNSFEVQSPIVFEGPNLTICIGRILPQNGRRLFNIERRDLVSLMKAYPADIIHAHWSYEYSWSAIESGIPTIVHLHDHATTILKYQTDPFRIMRWLMNFIVLRKAKHLIANSPYLFNLLSKSNQQKAVIVNNFYGKGLENLFDNSLGKRNFLLSVSSGFSRRKNIQTALFAFQLIRKQFPTLEYHLIGADMEPGGMAYNFAKENNLLEGVVFKGHQSFDRILEQMSYAKVFLHPSREESFGLSVLEAMLVGTPVIGGRFSGNIPYLLDHGNAGLLCDVESPQDIADKAITLLNDETLILALTEKAYQFAQQNYSEEAIVNLLEEQYNTIFNLYYGHKANSNFKYTKV